MKWAGILLLLVYAALKGARLAFVTTSGFGDAPVTFGKRLRSGEPTLFIIALLLSVPPVLGAIWYHKRKFTAILNESTACYGRILAYRNVPEIERTNDESAIYAAFEGYQASAFDAARQLGMSLTMVQRQLDAAAAMSVSDQKAHGAGRFWQDQIDSTRRCLQPPREVPNA